MTDSSEFCNELVLMQTDNQEKTEMNSDASSPRIVSLFWEVFIYKNLIFNLCIFTYMLISN